MRRAKRRKIEKKTRGVWKTYRTDRYFQLSTDCSLDFSAVVIARVTMAAKVSLSLSLSLSYKSETQFSSMDSLRDSETRVTKWRCSLANVIRQQKPFGFIIRDGPKLGRRKSTRRTGRSRHQQVYPQSDAAQNERGKKKKEKKRKILNYSLLGLREETVVFVELVPKLFGEQRA